MSEEPKTDPDILESEASAETLADALTGATPSDAAVDEETPAAETAPVESSPEDFGDFSDSRWYAIHVYSGCEQKVLKNIQYRLDVDALAEYVGRILVPTHDVIEIKDGKKVQSQKNLMPGYVLIEMKYNEDVIDLVGKLANVAGFVGDGTKPIPLDNSEVEGLLAQTSHRQEKPKTEMLYSKGEQVKIIEGPFGGFNGQISDVDPQRGKLSVMVSIFGRQTAVELDVLQVDKL